MTCLWTRAADRADPTSVDRDAQGAVSHIIHTREGHRPDLSDLPMRTNVGARVASVPASATLAHAARILVAREPGWDIIPELAPLPGEVVIDKPGKGSFCATDLERFLRTRGFRTSH
jgi:nicotinamidase-related amidase